jgi:hypothetical protein
MMLDKTQIDPPKKLVSLKRRWSALVVKTYSIERLKVKCE